MSWKHSETFDPRQGLAAFWNLNKVSDNTYFSDLSDRVGLTSQTTLPREGGVTYANGPWPHRAGAGVPDAAGSDAPPAPPYNRVPQMQLALPSRLDGAHVLGHAEYADFRNPIWSRDSVRTHGRRSRGRSRAPRGSSRPQAGVHARVYELNEVGPTARTRTT